MSSKQAIDESLLKIYITTLTNTINKNISDGKEKANEIAFIDDELKKIGDVDFSVEEYDNLQNNLSQTSNKIAVLRERFRSIDHNINHLKSSEICPTCHRKLDNVDNSKRIQELTKELDEVKSDGKVYSDKQKELTTQLENLKANRELYNKKSQLTIKKSALEVNVERLRNEYKENMSLKKEYDKNSEAIDKNNKIDIQIRNTDVFIRDKRNTKETNISYITRNKTEIKSYTEQIERRDNIIKRIKEEEILLKNWKIYLDLVGKNGITKMVLRKTLPIINAKLAQLLGDVCDFDVEVGINLKNEVMFYLIKDGVYSDLYSGSGFEKTAAALALRAVLANMSTIPRCNFLIFDEILGRVAKENYDNIKHLIEKILNDYDFIINITHLDDFKDFCEYHITVSKENNISRINLK